MKLALLCLLALLGAGCVDVKIRSIPAEGSPCEVSTECPLAAPVCDVAGSGTCVRCVPGDAAACTGLTPACAEDLTCRACQAHSDCASNACLPDGSCALEAEVVYLNEVGTGASCTRTAPCSDFDAALAKLDGAHRYLRLTGAVTGGGELVSLPFTILGEQGATLRNNTPRALLDLRTGGDFALYDVALEPFDIGINVDSNARLLLHRVKISGGRGDGLLLRSGTTTVTESELTGGSRRGISLQGGELTVTRSVISGYLGGGIFVGLNLRFSITNTFIVGNSGDGGLSAQRPGAGSALEHNTIVDNRNTGTGIADPGGVLCDDASFTFANNIIFRNTRAAGSAQTFGACKFTGSYVAVGTGASDASLAFRKDTAPRDYHLTAASPAAVRDVAAAVCTGQVDYDGEARPQGGACDLGADEVN